ncbi:MAG: tyrosine-type recombinase/integrase, partial [Acidobacteriota bacterium]
AILYFLDNNEIELNKRKIRRYYPSDESVYDDKPYSVSQTQQILSVCNLRTRAMILLMVSTGVRIGSLHSMQIQDLTEVDFQGSKLYKVQVYARTRDRYTCFTTSESYNAVQEYLEYRKRCGEDPLKDKSPLFRKGFNKADPFTINVPKFLSMGGVTRAFDEIIKKSGVKSSECMRTHSWRKAYKSTCEQSGMKSINVEMLLGHDIGVSGHYYRPAESDLLEDYMTHAADALTISSEHRLKQENQALKNDYFAELGDLKEDFNEMKQLLVHLSKESQKQLVDEFSQKVEDKADIEWSCD